MAQLIAGVDEAGRGPLAGPVVAAAVIFQDYPIPEQVKDSKKLTEKKREIVFDEILASAQAWSIALATAEEIDELNIHHATLLAMKRAIEGLPLQPTQCLIDGKFSPKVTMPCRAIIQGDATVSVISAASILAKVTRDRLLRQLHEEFPHYAFDQHKGYGTVKHITALKAHGPCIHHRRSFRPVSELLQK